MKSLFLSLALASSLSAFGDAVLTAHIEGLPDGTPLVARLTGIGVSGDILAAATLEGGTAVLALPLTEPRFVAVCVKDVPGHLFALMTTDGERPQVEATVKETVRGGEKVYIEAEKTIVYDSPLHAEYVLRVGSHRERLDLCYEAMHNAYRSLDKAAAAGDTTLRHSPAYAAYGESEKAFFNDVETTFGAAIQAGKETWWGPFAMLNLYSSIRSDETNEARWASFSPAAKESFYGQVLDKQLHPKGLCGEKYLPLMFNDAKGKTVSVENLVKGKTYFLIDFWASWCRPCRKEIPNLKALYTQYKEKGLEIISISLDRDEDAWRKALDEEQLPWPNGLDRYGAGNIYQVKAIPAIFLVDGATGKILADNLRGESLATKLAELMK